MRSPLVSILIPCYNAEKWLAETLESALSQTWGNIEIILVDDGSTDNSLAIARNYESKNVKVIAQENRGASSARNTTLKHAQGDFIQYLDADDILSIDKVEAQINTLLHNPGKVSVCKTLHFYDEENYGDGQISDECFLYDTDDPVEFLIKLYGGYGQGGMIQPNAYLTPRNVIEKAGLWDESCSTDDDGEYFCRVLLASTGIRLSKQGCNYYRKHTKVGNLSNVNSRLAMNSILKCLDLKSKYIFEKTNSERAKSAIARMYAQHAVLSYPAYQDIFLDAFQKARKLGLDEIEYVGGNKGHLVAKFFGWKAARILSYLLYELK